MDGVAIVGCFCPVTKERGLGSSWGRGEEGGDKKEEASLFLHHSTKAASLPYSECDLEKGRRQLEGGKRLRPGSNMERAHYTTVSLMISRLLSLSFAPVFFQGLAHFFYVLRAREIERTPTSSRRLSRGSEGGINGRDPSRNPHSHPITPFL